jgi:4-hydroxythreonine-4-phosphate dehydrogenase
VLVTLGDPAGIGPEIVAKALASFAPPADIRLETVGHAADATPGCPTERTAKAALDALEFAAAELAAGRADAVATAPVSKHQLQRIGFPFPGQTEFFAARLGAADHAMCLTGKRLTVALATIHVPLADVPKLLEIPRLVRCALLLEKFLARRGTTRPRVAVCGLNPHAGENGAFGDEEARIIDPAIRQMRKQCPTASFSGPHVPDAVFRAAAAGEYDAVLAMYHDQGLIPFKLLDFDCGVNVTLGLPKPRTSPDHGTAWSLAGRDCADPSSMLAAIRLACELA